MARPRLAERGVVIRTHPGRDPDAPLLVEHRIVRVRLAGPDRLVAPVRRWSSDRPGPGGVRVTDSYRDLARRMSLRIEHRHVVGARLEHRVERSVRVDRG